MKIFRFFSTLILISIFLLPASAQSERSIKILGVAVQGNKTISENSIKIQSGLIDGKEIAFEDISSAINRLWKLKLFSDIQVYVDKTTDEGIFLIIKIDEYPRIGKFEVRGNKKIKKNKIDEEVNLLPGKVLSPYLILESKRKIKKLYEKDGYLLVEIQEELKEGKRENTQDLIFNIKENKKVHIKNVEFEGNDKFSDSKLRRVMKDTRKRNLFLFRVGDFNKEKYEEDKDKLKAFYGNEGYRDFEILYDSIKYSNNSKSMFIKIGINEGPKYKYRNITFSGNRLYSNDQLLALLHIKSGDWYNTEEFQKGVYDRINGLYMDQGYLFFQIIPHEIPVSEDEIDVHLEITENHQVSINQINIVGNSKTYENVIRRELKVFPGDIFSREALIRSQREIFILNYFSNVTPDVIPVNEKEIDVEITVEEKSSDRANMSLSISQMHGLIGGGGVEFNNFLGRGQQVNISYQQGAQYSIMRSGATPYKSISIGFNDPWIFDTPNLVGISFFYSERGGRGYYYYPFDLSQLGGSIRWGRRFKWPDNYFRGTWILNASEKEYKNLDESYLQNVLLGNAKTTGISITQVIARDSRNRPEFPTMGSVMRWSSTLSGGFLGGTEHFHKHIFSLEFYMPTFWKFVLFNHVEFGVIKKLYKTGIIPPDERFIMGGSGMIYGVPLRGYDDNQVGPKRGSYSSSYLPYGGETLFKYSLEYRFPISEEPTIYALAFVEAGNVWKNLSTTDPFDIRRSAGVGIRFFMPALGMIGVDFGYGFDDIDPEGATGYGKPQGWKTHFIFGMPF